MLVPLKICRSSLIRHYRRCFSGNSSVAVATSESSLQESQQDSTAAVANAPSDDTRGCASFDEPSDLGEPYLPSVSTKPKLIYHVFRWGVGNAFRSHSKNRFKPTHAERNTAVSIPEEYFSCSREFEHCRIAYDRLNEQWEVLWNEFGKVNGKPFPVKKFGIDAAKAESIAFAEELDRRLSSQASTEKEQPKEPGLTFDHTLHCWVSLGRVGTRPVARAFSAEYHGYENARQLASDFKNA